jgi:hypothetical protein
MLIKRGGGIINRRLFLSVLLLFGLALILNVSTSSAAVTADKSIPKVTSIDPVYKDVVGNSKIIKVKFSEPIKTGTKWIELKNSHGAVKQTTIKISGRTVSIIPKSSMARGTKYNLILHSGSLKDLSGNRIAKFSSTFTVSSLTMTQMKNGIYRTQKFLQTHNRLPKFVSYGKTKIPIAQFQKIVASSNIKINAISSGTGRPVYITSDNIINSAKDNARIESIVKGLRSLGIKAFNMGLGPNTHIQVLKSGQVPSNALIVDIYGGACAGTLYEMGTSWYKSLRGTNEVFTVFWPPSKYITGLPFLVRAHDDNFSPASFTGLAHPDKYLIQNGYNYLYSGDISHIVSAIQYQATH